MQVCQDRSYAKSQEGRRDLETLVFEGLHRYRVEKRLSGGMGEVCLLRKETPASAFQRIWRTTLAAKTFKDGEFAQANAALFHRELHVWITLDAPHLVPLLSIQRVSGSLCALMPAFEGNARALAPSMSLTPRSVLALAKATLECLGAVWQRYRTVHLDVKPENILWSRRSDGTPDFFVTDWGIASVQSKWLERVGGSVPDLEQALAAMGTLPYMSPERILGGPLVPAADVFSVGMMMLELATGHLPYESSRSLTGQLTSAEYLTSAARLLDDLGDSRLAAVVLKALDPDPRRRFDNCLKFLAAIEKL